MPAPTVTAHRDLPRTPAAQGSRPRPVIFSSLLPPLPTPRRRLGVSRPLPTHRGLVDEIAAQLPDVLEHGHAVLPAVLPELAGREPGLQHHCGPCGAWGGRGRSR